MAVSIQNDGTHPGEYRRETGTGIITAVDRSGGRNHYVTINAEHLAEDVKGWADSHAGTIAQTITAAHEQGQRIAYVIDVHRTRSTDPAIPFAELGRRQKVRDLVEVYPVNGAGDPVAVVGDTPDSAADRQRRHVGYREAEAAAQRRTEQADPTPPDPVAAASERLEELTGQTAPPADQAPPAATGPLRPCPRCGHPLGTLPLRRGSAGMEHRECPEVDGPVDVAEEAASAAEDAATDTSPPIGAGEGPQEQGDAPSGPQEPPTGSAPLSPPAARSPRRGRHEEARPWDYYNTDGSLNPGSYAMTAAVGMVELAAQLILEHNRVTGAATGRPVETPTRGQVLNLARRLIGAADEVQMNIRADGYSDRMDMSHTRARGAIRSALDLYPVPFGAERDDRDRWHADLVAYGTLLLEVSSTLLEVHQ